MGTQLLGIEFVGMQVKNERSTLARDMARRQMNCDAGECAPESSASDGEPAPANLNDGYGYLYQCSTPRRDPHRSKRMCCNALVTANRTHTRRIAEPFVCENLIRPRLHSAETEVGRPISLRPRADKVGNYVE